MTNYIVRLFLDLGQVRLPTVDAMEVLIKYCMNSFPQVDRSNEFKFLFTSCAFPIGQSVLKRNLIGSSKSNRKLINFLSNELINLRK
jgi:hypothetical protein